MLVLYVYVDGRLIATTTATVTDVAAGGTVPVHFAGTDPWQPGQKVLLLQTALTVGLRPGRAVGAPDRRAAAHVASSTSASRGRERRRG